MVWLVCGRLTSPSATSLSGSAMAATGDWRDGVCCLKLTFASLNHAVRFQCSCLYLYRKSTNLGAVASFPVLKYMYMYMYVHVSRALTLCVPQVWIRYPCNCQGRRFEHMPCPAWGGCMLAEILSPYMYVAIIVLGNYIYTACILLNYRCVHKLEEYMHVRQC